MSVAVVAVVEQRHWLVLFAMDGVMESAYARGETHLTAEQRARLAEADTLLLQQARRFYQAIQCIADLEAWRRQQGTPPAH